MEIPEICVIVNCVWKDDSMSQASKILYLKILKTEELITQSKTFPCLGQAFYSNEKSSNKHFKVCIYDWSICIGLITTHFIPLKYY